MKKRTALVAIPVALAATAGGVAWAVLSGVVYLPDVMQGVANANGSGGCQQGALSFTLPTPTWDNALGDFAVSTVDYGGVDQACQNLGTADLQLQLTNQGATIGSGTAQNLQTSGGTLQLTAPIAYSDAAAASFSYLVVG